MLDKVSRISKTLDKYKFNSEVIHESLQAIVSEQEENKTFATFKKRQIIFHEGSVPLKVYVVRSGKVKITQTNKEGAVQINFIFTKGEIFGFRPILSNEKHPASAIAIQDCELYAIKKEAFLTLVNGSHELCKQLLFNLSHEYSVFINRLNFSAQKGIKEKIALTLLLLHDKYKIESEANEGTEIKINRTELAQYVGTSLENLVRNLRFFRESQLIEITGKCIKIKNIQEIVLISSI